jgi:hypothetical protein
MRGPLLSEYSGAPGVAGAGGDCVSVQATGNGVNDISVAVMSEEKCTPDEDENCGGGGEGVKGHN